MIGPIVLKKMERQDKEMDLAIILLFLVFLMHLEAES